MTPWQDVKSAGDLDPDASVVALETHDKIRAERDALREALERLLNAAPAFQFKPIGAPHSPARLQQEKHIAAETAAKAVLGALNSTDGDTR